MSRRSDDIDAGACRVSAVDESAVRRALQAVPGEGEIRALADIYSALADPTRLRILLALSAEKLCVCDLAAIAGVSASGVSHQLRLLRDRDLVSFERDGKRAVYRLADEHVTTLLQQAWAHVRECS